MKFLILLSISFSAMANYIPKSKIESQSKTVWLKKSKCEKVELESCIKIDKDYSHEYSKIRPEKWLKEQAESCLDEIDCQSKFESLECLSDNFRKIKNIDSLEVYCTKYRPEKVVDDEVKKMAYDAKILKKKNREGKIQKGKGRRVKCENFLSYISGEFSEADEASVDVLTAQFADIISAANSCKMKKLKRLLGEIVDPAYEELKLESLEILK